MALKFTNLRKVLGDYINEVKSLYQDNLIKSDHLATEHLLNSVETVMEVGNTYVMVGLKLEDYWKYVEYDTKPHWPPEEAILQWIRVKPIIPTEKNGRVPTEKQLSFLIRRAIAGESPNPDIKGGTKGTGDLEDAVKAVNRHYESIIIDAITQDLGEGLTAILIEYLVQ